MSSLHSDKGWLCIAFRLGRKQPRLYLGLRDVRANRRSPLVKEVRGLIDRQEFGAGPSRGLADDPNASSLSKGGSASASITELAGEGPSRALNGVLAFTMQGGPSSASITGVAQLEDATGRDPGHLPVRVRPPVPTSFADKPLRLIGASDIAALYAPVAKRGHQAQAQNIRRVVSAVFNWARGERGTDGEYLVADNPVTRTRPVKRDEPHEVNPFSDDEIARICAAAPEGWQRRLIVVAFETGLRPNELFGLKRKDIEIGGPSVRGSLGGKVAPRTVHGNAEAPEMATTIRAGGGPLAGNAVPPIAFLHIRQTYSRFGEGSTKTRGSRRSVPLSDAAVQALRAQLAEVALRSLWLWPIDRISLRGDAASSKNKGRVSAAAIPSASASPRISHPHKPGLVGRGAKTPFVAGANPAPVASPHNPQNFSHNWARILKRAAVKHREFYQCRHTYATRLLAQGVPMQEIARRMGHESLRMLVDHYWKWAPPEKPERQKVGR